MDAETILTVMKMTQPLATIEHAEVMEAYGRDRGLTPFAEFYPIFAENRKKQNSQWVTIGLKSLSFKEHYSIQQRWAQKSGGYSTPHRETIDETETDRYGKEHPGLRVTVGIITNRDYAALARMAAMEIPGWDYLAERKAFLHYGSSFVRNSHRPPSGWTVQGVARKRATEMALKLAFGREPTRAGAIYSMTMDSRPELALDEAKSALYPALPAPVVEAEVKFDEPPATPFDADSDPAMVEALKAEADAAQPETPTRPYAPQQLRVQLRRSIQARRTNRDTLGPRLANFKMATIGNLESCFNSKRDQARHLVTDYLIGKASSKDWDNAETLALHRWLNATESDGVWVVDQLAVTEASAVLPVAMEAAGQTSFITEE